MSEFPDKIYSVAAVREIDRAAIEDAGIPGYELMTRAASAAFRAIRERYPEAQRLQIVCGAGNNAGDGYALARLAADDGQPPIPTSLLARERRARGPGNSMQEPISSWTHCSAAACSGT
jgi:hydroxyethylthiazole kinase-like uncharacterized protein yjeF